MRARLQSSKRPEKERSWWADERCVLAIGIILLVVDQAVKWLFITQRPEVDLFLFRLHYVMNTGASFGIMQGQNALLVWIAVIVLGAFMFFYDQLESAYRKLGIIVIAGVLSNLADRVVHGGVVDYIDFGWFPIFNIADALIVGGVMVISVLLWREEGRTSQGLQENKK